MTRTSTFLAWLGGGLVLAAGAGLWLRFGEGVFVDALMSGIAGCFM